MFQFSFFNSDKIKDDENIHNNDQESSWFPSEEIVVKELPVLQEILKADKEINTFKCDDCPAILHVSVNLVVEIIRKNFLENSILNAETNHSDLVPAIYEGGLKIWECTYDLVKYISNESIQLSGKKILDLGCGVGVLGILSLIKSAQVYFQDYNREVIQYVTIPNVLLNLNKYCGIENLTNCKFYCGDWKSFSEIIKTNCVKFDYIFTSETIYNESNYKKLHTVLKDCLNDNGIVYLSAKTYYFGVGGGLRSFEDFTRKEGVFDYEVCWKSIEGMQREILKITLKCNNT